MITMSLVCNHCGHDMKPSAEAPEREGVLVYPHVMSLVYVPSEDGFGYKMGYVQAPASRSLCFECLEAAGPDMDILDDFYECRKLEIVYNEIESSQKGRFVGGNELKKGTDAYKVFSTKFKTITDDCIFCGGSADNGDPFFSAVALDPIHGKKHPSGFGMDNYSWSNLGKLSTRFMMCADDFQKYFPEIFKQLSCDILGEPNPEARPGTNEIYISPDFEQALKDHGKNPEDVVNDLADSAVRDGTNLRIIRET